MTNNINESTRKGELSLPQGAKVKKEKKEMTMQKIPKEANALAKGLAFMREVPVYQLLEDLVEEAVKKERPEWMKGGKKRKGER